MRLILLITTCLLYCTVTIQAQERVFYEDFAGGIPDTWEIGPGTPEGAVWQWRSNGAPDSAFINGVLTPAWSGIKDFLPIASVTPENGAAMYNSDVYSSGGIDQNAGPYGSTEHRGVLTSPTIDCSSLKNVTLKFNQWALVNSGRRSTFLEISGDGGENWEDILINEDITAGEITPRNSIIAIDITDFAAGNANVKIRFIWQGYYFFWLIDDIEVIETPGVNLAVTDFFYPAASYATPVSQIDSDTMAFFANVSNNGSDTVKNVVLRASITDNDGEEYFVDSLVIDALPPFYQDSLIFLNGTFVPKLEQGIYFVDYLTYSQDTSDFNPFDNFKFEAFEVTTTLYSKDDDRGFDGVRPGDDTDYEFGNVYLTSSNISEKDTLTATKAFFASVKNESDGPIAGEQVTIFLYKIKDEIRANYENFDVDSDESLEVKGFGTYTFTDDYQGLDIVEVDLLDAFSTEPGVALEPGARYIITAKYEGSARTIFHAVDSGVGYNRIFSTVVKSGNDWFPAGFRDGPAAVLRMQIDFREFKMDVDVDDEPLPPNAVSVYPNPTQSELNLDLQFEQASTGMVYIADLSGKIIQMRELNNIQNQVMTFNFADLAAGTYIVRVRTQDGVSNQKFVKIN